jgi:hypothetical protein
VVIELLAALTLEQAASLYALAYGQYGSQIGGFQLPEKAPIIKEVPQSELQQMYGCNCNIQGVQYENKIFLNQALNYGEPYGASILIHEYVHYFQYVQRGSAVDCKDSLAREHQAYGIQIRMMERSGIDSRGVKVAASSLRCAPEEPAPGVGI